MVLVPRMRLPVRAHGRPHPFSPPQSSRATRVPRPEDDREPSRAFLGSSTWVPDVDDQCVLLSRTGAGSPCSGNRRTISRAPTWPTPSETALLPVLLLVLLPVLLLVLLPVLLLVLLPVLLLVLLPVLLLVLLPVTVVVVMDPLPLPLPLPRERQRLRTATTCGWWRTSGGDGETGTRVDLGRGLPSSLAPREGKAFGGGGPQRVVIGW
jgi:hypothetical protein